MEKALTSLVAISTRYRRLVPAHLPGRTMAAGPGVPRGRGRTASLGLCSAGCTAMRLATRSCRIPRSRARWGGARLCLQGRRDRPGERAGACGGPVPPRHFDEAERIQRKALALNSNDFRHANTTRVELGIRWTGNGYPPPSQPGTGMRRAEWTGTSRPIPGRTGGGGAIFLGAWWLSLGNLVLFSHG